MSKFMEELNKIKEELAAGTVKNKTDALIAEFSEKPVILYGAGTLSTFVMEHLERHHVAIRCFCDTFRPGVHKSTGLPIISADQLKEEFSDAVVIITSEQHGQSIMNTLKKIEYPGKIYTFDELLCFYTIPFEEFEPHVEGYAWAYDHYTDAISKSVVIEDMRTRLLGTHMTPSQNPQYFEPDIFPMTEHEVFVDGGCFIGDTAEVFIKEVNGKFDFIYGFEPDENNLKKAVANLSEYENIQVMHGGLWHMTNTYKFVSGAFGNSKFSDEGDVITDTFGLDDFFADKEFNPTFIKMDIEGAERLALDGAAGLLKEVKPKLAICVYHSIKDMYDLPQRILYHNPEYKLALRHYSNWYAESVCFAY